jgi:hypothetical protein
MHFHITKSLSSRRREYVSGATDRVFAKCAHDCTVLDATHLLCSQRDMVRQLTLKVRPGNFALAAGHGTPLPEP